MKKTIGIIGYAGTGKDVMAQMMLNHLNNVRKIKAKRFSFADILKLELRDVFLSHGIDLLTCPREDKEKVRNVLVEYGLFLRNQTQGRYLVDKVQKQIEEDDCEVAIVTDVRYLQYEKDEFYWLTQEMKGKFVLLARYWLDVPYEKGYDFMTEPLQPITAKVSWTPPANDVEKENMIKIREAVGNTVHPSQYISLSWCSFNQADGIEEAWKKHIGGFVDNYLL